MVEVTKKTEMIEKEVETERTCYCDVCKTLIYRKDLLHRESNVIQKIFYYGNTSHSDWGNDSGESYEDFHICSPVCLASKMMEYINETSETNNTLRIEFEHDSEYSME